MASIASVTLEVADPTAAEHFYAAAFGLPRWSVEEVRARVRRSLRESFPEVFGSEWERARDIFYAEVRARHLQVLSPMPGAAEALRAAVALSPAPAGLVESLWAEHGMALSPSSSAAAATCLRMFNRYCLR